MEIRFYVTVAALRYLDPLMSSDEQGYLRTFDENRTAIESLACKVYQVRRKSSCFMDVSDFRNAAIAQR